MDRSDTANRCSACDHRYVRPHQSRAPPANQQGETLKTRRSRWPAWELANAVLSTAHMYRTKYILWNFSTVFIVRSPFKRALWCLYCPESRRLKMQNPVLLFRGEAVTFRRTNTTNRYGFGNTEIPKKKYRCQVPCNIILRSRNTPRTLSALLKLPELGKKVLGLKQPELGKKKCWV